MLHQDVHNICMLGCPRGIITTVQVVPHSVQIGPVLEEELYRRRVTLATGYQERGFTLGVALKK